MTSILIVADNRLFVRRAYALFQENPDFAVHVIFQSTAVFEAYLEHPSDVVLIDAGTFLPWDSMIDQFLEYRWNCVFLIANCKDPPPFDLTREDVIFVDLERDNLRRVISTALQPQKQPTISGMPHYITGDDGSVLSELDLYYLMLSSCLAQEGRIYSQQELSQLKIRLASVGKVEILSVLQQDILILMKQSTMRRPGAFREIHKILSESTQLPYGSLCCERVGLNELDDVCLKLVNCAPLGYCFGARCLTLSQLSVMRKSRPSGAVYPFFVQLIGLLLQGNQTGLVTVLQEVYLHWVKEFADWDTLQAFHLWQSFFENTLLQHHIPGFFPKDGKFGSADAECEKICTYWSELLRLYAQAPFLPVVEASIDELLLHYDDCALSLEAIAQRIGFAKAYVSRAFKEQTGMTLIEFLQRLRLQHAACLLRGTSLSIKEIARKTGYSDAQYFSKAFRRYMNLHPTEFRKLQKQEDRYACIDP